jgi:hypothetical protein
MLPALAIVAVLEVVEVEVAPRGWSIGRYGTSAG